MKEIKNRSGKVVKRTMTVSELRDALLNYPGDLPVLAEWEGVRAPIDQKNFEIGPVSRIPGVNEEACLVIDVNEY